MYLEKEYEDRIMKKFLIMSMFLSLGMSTYASIKQLSNNGNTINICNHIDTENTQLIQPTYLSNITETSDWGSNWFVEVKGGASAFIGSPIGCGDVFDRTKPVLQVGLGKWFTPAIGGRVSYQGLQFKNANLVNMDYQYYHADFMYNLTHNLQQNEHGLSKLDVAPFIGVGIIRNSSTNTGYIQSDGKSSGNHPFAFGCGVEVRCHLYDRLHLVGEINGMTILKNSDYVGSSCKFGDNMLSLSVGLSYTIGRKGWEKVIDAVPYIRQNQFLMGQSEKLKTTVPGANTNDKGSDKNNYGGLNSLRYRLSLSEANSDDGMVKGNDSCMIGTPVYFYFKLNSTKLVDKSQLANLDEIVRIAKEQDLAIHISGAADSATGTSSINRKLSKERAKCIGKLLIKRGIEKEKLKAVSLGGVNQFSPREANRFTVVLLKKNL